MPLHFCTESWQSGWVFPDDALQSKTAGLHSCCQVALYEELSCDMCILGACPVHRTLMRDISLKRF